MPLGAASYMGAGAGQAPTPDAGIPIQQAMAPTGAPDQQALNEVVMMLKSGQAGAERLMQVLAMLAQSTVPQMQQQAPQQGGAPPTIQGLLG